MPSIKLLFVLVAAALTMSYAASTGSNGHGNARLSLSAEDKLRFQELLESVDATALHNVLVDHVKDKYQQGVFHEVKNALEAVHQEAPEVASSLVELAKRQATNVTVTTTQTATTSADATTAPAETTSVSVSRAPDPSTTPAATTSQVVVVVPTNSQAPPAASTTNQAVAPTTTTQAAAPTTTGEAPVANSPSANPTTTNAPASDSNPTIIPTTETTAAQTTADQTTAAVVPGQTTNESEQSPTTLTTAASAADQPNTTARPTSQRPTNAPSVTQQTIYTTTLANGAVQTVTSITVVPGQLEQTGQAGSSKTSAAKGSLQTNGASSIKKMGLGGIAGGLGMMLAGAL